MFSDKDFEELWDSGELYDRFRNGDFALSDRERQIIIAHMDRFFDYIDEQKEVPLLDLTLFNEFLLELLLSENDELLNIAFRAVMRNSMLRNRLMEDQEKQKEKEDTAPSEG